MAKGKNEAKQFSCLKCGEPFEVYPPDSQYTDAKLDPCTEGCDKVMNKICQSCKNEIKIYWCTGHWHYASA